MLVHRFLEEVIPGGEDVHVIVTGNNDLMRWIENVTTTDGILETITSVQPRETFQEVAAGIQRSLDRLYAAGARKFFGVGPLGHRASAHCPCWRSGA